MSEAKSRSGFSRNFSANLLSLVIIAIISFFLSPFIVGKFGAAGYGTWSLASGLLGYLGLLDFGIRQAVNRFTAHHHAKNEHQESSAVVVTSLKILSIASFIAIVLSFALAAIIPVVFNIPVNLIDDAQVVIVLGGFGVGLSLICGVPGGVVTGVQRFDVQSILDVSIAVLRAVGTVITLNNGGGLVGLAVVNVAASALNLIGYSIAARMLYRELHIEISQPMMPHGKKIISFATSSFVIFVLASLSLYADNVIIGVFMPVEAIAYYAIAANLCFQASGVSDAAAHLMTPRISAMASRDSSRIGQQILSVSKMATLLICPVALTFLLRGESFIGLWMGIEYAKPTGSVLAILAVSLWLGGTRLVILHSLIGLGKQKVVIPGYLAESLAKVALSIGLIHEYGVIGVAMGTLIPSVFIVLWYLPRCLTKSTNVAFNSLMRHAIILPTLSCIPFALGTIAIEMYLPASSLLLFFVQIFCVLPLVPAAAWYLCLSMDEKRKIKEDAGKFIGRHNHA